MKKQLVKPITQMYAGYEEGILRGMSVNSVAESALHSSMYVYPRWTALVWSRSHQDQYDTHVELDDEFDEWFEDMQQGVDYTNSEFGFRFVRNK